MSYASKDHQKQGIVIDRIGWVISILINVTIFTGFINLNHSAPSESEVKEKVQWVALTALGESLPPQLVPRLIAPVAPPPEASEVQSISRIKEESKPVEKKKTNEKRRTEEEQKKRKKKKPKKKKRRKKVTLNELFDAPRDPRADRGPRRGDKRGHREGSSTKWNNNLAMDIYINRIRLLLERQFRAPSTLTKKQLKRLSATIWIKINSSGKIVGNPKWIKHSGNKFFDDAATRAIEMFRVKEGKLKLSLPRDPEMKRVILRRGMKIILKGMKT